MNNEKNKLRKAIIEKLKTTTTTYGVVARAELDLDQEEELITILYNDLLTFSLQEQVDQTIIDEIVNYNIKFNKIEIQLN